MKSYFYLSRKKTNVKGKAPIYCRIQLSTNNRCDFSTGIFILPNQWNSNTSMPLTTLEHEYHTLLHIQQKANAAILEARVRNIHNAIEIASMAKGKKNEPINNLTQVLPDFFKYIKATIRMRSDITRIVKEFNKVVQVSPDKINIKHISNFEHAQYKLGFQSSTVARKQATIKRIITYCIQTDLLTNNPFVNYKAPKIEHTPQVHITLDQLTQLEKHTFSQERLNHVKDLFLLQCYTGFAYVDLKGFSLDNIQQFEKQKFIIGSRSKNGNEFMVPLNHKAENIINNGFEVMSNQKYNSYLKEIAVIMDWNIKLTTHVGRKTFAQIMINKGFSWEAVAAMLGHKKTTMTETHYAKIGLERIQKELHKIAA